MFESIITLSETVPATGDRFPFAAIGIVAALAVAAIIVVTVLSKKEKKKNNRNKK